MASIIKPDLDQAIYTPSEVSDIGLKNIQAILEEAGYNFDDVVKSTVLLKNISDFAAMNEIYGQVYNSKAPARAAYEVANLPLGALIEIETIAMRNCM